MFAQFKLIISQKKLLGIAIAFYAVYRFFLQDPQTVKNLGASYAIFIQVWIIVMATCAGFSGWEFALYIWDLIKEKFTKPKVEPEK